MANLEFQFLSYSNSQLKSHSAWFLCRNNPDSIISEEEIVKYMGNFDKEKNILKKYARKGQCFSTSKFICNMTKNQVLFGLEDVHRGEFCFSDGVGYISKELAETTARKLGYTYASAF